MPSCKFTCNFSQEPQSSVVREDTIETAFIEKLLSLKYDYRRDITDRATLELNFRKKFEALNRVLLTDGEFARLLGEIITPDVVTAARTLRERNSFTRDDGTPLNYTRRKEEGRMRKDEQFPLLHSSFRLPTSPHPPLLPPALHRQQPHRDLLLRQQQRPPLRFQRRRTCKQRSSVRWRNGTQLGSITT